MTFDLKLNFCLTSLRTQHTLVLIAVHVTMLVLFFLVPSNADLSLDPDTDQTPPAPFLCFIQNIHLYCYRTLSCSLLYLNPHQLLSRYNHFEPNLSHSQDRLSYSHTSSYCQWLISIPRFRHFWRNRLRISQNVGRSKSEHGARRSFQN